MIIRRRFHNVIILKSGIARKTERSSTCMLQQLEKTEVLRRIVNKVQLWYGLPYPNTLVSATSLHSFKNNMHDQGGKEK